MALKILVLYLTSTQSQACKDDEEEEGCFVIFQENEEAQCISLKFARKN